MTKFNHLAWVLFFLAVMLTAGCSSEQGEEAAEALAASPLVGAWQKTDDGAVVEFFPDGRYQRSNGEIGRWSLPESGVVVLENETGPVKARARSPFEIENGKLRFLLTKETYHAVAASDGQE